MNFVQLRAFHSVAVEGSFTRAAERMNVTQPTLSGQVKDLEQSFGVKLFERRGRGVVLTELGERLLEISHQFFELERAAKHLLTTAQTLSHGRLRVGADAPHLILPVLAKLEERFPGIKTNIAFGNSRQLMEGLLEASHDVAILPDVAPEPRLFRLPLQRFRLVAFVRKTHPWAQRRIVRLRELGAQRLLLRETGSQTRAMLERALDLAGIKAEQTLELGSREAVREAAAGGLGIGIVAATEFGPDERLRQLAIEGPGLESTEFAVCLASNRSNQIVDAFFSVLQETFSA